MNENYHDFVRQYRMTAEMSTRQYATTQFNSPMIAPNGVYNEHHFIAREPGVQLTMCQRDLDQLIQDATMGRQVRQLHTRNPAVLEAWDQYRMLLALTAQDNGIDLP